MARPSDYTDEQAVDICEWISEGKSLRQYTQEKKLGYATVMQWLAKNPAFAEQYAIAREAAAHLYAEEIIDIADDKTEDPQSRRVRIDARKWYAGKLKPKVYGDRIRQEHTGTLTIEDALRQLAAENGWAADMAPGGQPDSTATSQSCPSGRLASGCPGE